MKHCRAANQRAVFCAALWGSGYSNFPLTRCWKHRSFQQETDDTHYIFAAITAWCFSYVYCFFFPKKLLLYASILKYKHMCFVTFMLHRFDVPVQEEMKESKWREVVTLAPCIRVNLFNWHVWADDVRHSICGAISSSFLLQG